MHTMKLQREYFDYIKFGTKKYEIRLNDEKRRSIKEGDFILFQKEPDRKEKITLMEDNIRHFSSFESLVDDIDIKFLASSETTKLNFLSTLNKFCPKGKQKDGVLALGLNKDVIINNSKIKEIGLDNKIFDGLRKCYVNFDNWLIKVKDNDIYYTEKDDKVSSILILKVDEKDSQQFFEDGKILKIRTLIVEDTFKGIGTMYMKLAENIARDNDIKYVYLTIKNQNKRLIEFVENLNYRRYGKFQDEFVYYKELS